MSDLTRDPTSEPPRPRDGTDPGDSPGEGHAILVKWMSATDANSAGSIHGGIVMKLCDEAAGLAAIRHARQRVVTAAVDRLTFLHPVRVGEVLTLSASVNAAWRTSMEVGVRVEAEDPFTGQTRHTSSAYLTMVAIDEAGAARRVPPLAAESPSAQRREREAQVRRVTRLAEREQIIAERDPGVRSRERQARTDDGSNPSAPLRKGTQ